MDQLQLSAPHGWVKKLTPKDSGTPRRNEIVFIAPTGEEIKSKRQLDQYLISHPGGPTASEFDWTTGDTPRRSARLSSKPKATDTPESGPSAKRQKKSTLRKEDEAASTNSEDGKDVEIKNTVVTGHPLEAEKSMETAVLADSADASVKSLEEKGVAIQQDEEADGGTFSDEKQVHLEAAQENQGNAQMPEETASDKGEEHPDETNVNSIEKQAEDRDPLMTIPKSSEEQLESPKVIKNATVELPAEKPADSQVQPEMSVSSTKSASR